MIPPQSEIADVIENPDYAYKGFSSIMPRLAKRAMTVDGKACAGARPGDMVRCPPWPYVLPGRCPCSTGTVAARRGLSRSPVSPPR